jgi:hypothetical protein
LQSNEQGTVLTSTRRSHQSLLLHIKENYEAIKKDHPDVPSKDIIGIMARQWAATNEEEKQIWKYRAEQMKDQYMDPALVQQQAAEIEQVGLTEPPSASDDNGGGKKRAVGKKEPAKSVSV